MIAYAFALRKFLAYVIAARCQAPNYHELHTVPGMAVLRPQAPAEVLRVHNNEPRLAGRFTVHQAHHPALIFR